MTAAGGGLRVLVVGAGGIGCEVLKNLVLSGVRRLTILDMDRVDLSNLNRQFLFARQDVGTYKADSAARALRNYVKPPDTLELTVHKMRIQDLPLADFQKHDVVISALDNIEARKFVNSMCVACGLPLMEAGSTGRNGQAYPLFATAGTECFECRAQPKVTVYPVCTIRLTAEKPEHCVAWARYLFESIFSPALPNETAPSGTEDDNALTDLGQHIRGLRVSAPSDIAFAQAAAIFLFQEQIQAYLDTAAASDELQKDGGSKRKLPTPHDWLKDHFAAAEANQKLDTSTSEHARQLQSREYYADQFVLALVACANKFANEGVKFDKDDEEGMAFVGSASNLRMENFSIPMMTAWDLKSMAGAIQPAIASTNAIVAGVEVLNVLRLAPILAAGGSIDVARLNDAGLRFVWTRTEPSSKRLLLAEKLDPASKTCLVCSSGSTAIVALKKLNQWSIGRFVKEVLEGALGGRDVTVQNAKTILYDPDLLEECPQLAERCFEGESELITVSWLGLGATDMIVREIDEETGSQEFVIIRALPDQVLTSGAWKTQDAAAAAADVENIQDEDLEEAVSSPIRSPLGGKRPRSPEAAEPLPSKKTKTSDK